MKVAIIGLGAMGSIYAALFATSGFEVIAYDPWVEHINAINEKGLLIENPDGSYIVKNIKASSIFKAHDDCNFYDFDNVTHFFLVFDNNNKLIMIEVI